MLSELEKGEVPLSPGLASRILREFRHSGVNDNTLSTRHIAEDTQSGQLTERQLEVLEMVAKGITYKEAGVALGLTERTVKYHMGRIIERLHLENRAQVIAYAASIGLIEGREKS
jgi:two-component system NarL family response regulator